MSAREGRRPEAVNIAKDSRHMKLKCGVKNRLRRCRQYPLHEMGDHNSTSTREGAANDLRPQLCLDAGEPTSPDARYNDRALQRRIGKYEGKDICELPVRCKTVDALDDWSVKPIRIERQYGCREKQQLK